MVTGSNVPLVISPITNITPFTYRDGATYLEMLAELTKYVHEDLREEFYTEMTRVISEFNESITTTQAAHTALIAAARKYVDDSIQFINNKTGVAQIERFTLTGAPYTVNVNPLWPNNHPIRLQAFQDATGGRSFDFGGDIIGGIDINPAPGGVTEFELVPLGSGKWHVVGTVSEPPIPEGAPGEYLNGNKKWATLDSEAVGLGSVDNTSDENKPISKAQEAEFKKQTLTVHTRAELEAALLVGGIINVSDKNEILLETPVVITKPTRLVGGRFRVPDNGTEAIRIASSFVTVDGVKITGPGTSGEYKKEMKFIYGVGTQLDQFSDVHVRNCVLQGSLADNIWLEWFKDIHISNNRVSDFLYSGIMVLSAVNFHIDGNTVKNGIMKSPVVNVYGIQATDMVNTDAARSRNGSISNNTVIDLPWEGIGTHGGYGITFSGNSILNCVRGIAMVAGNSSRITVPEACVVTGNYVNGNGVEGEREGIGLFGISGKPADAVISGNVIQGYTYPFRVTLNDRAKTYVGGNNVPRVEWTDLPMRPGWTSHPTWPAQYKVDGRNLFLRGLVVPTSNPQNSLISQVSAAFTPLDQTVTFIRHVQGASPESDQSFELSLEDDGEIHARYMRGTNLYACPIGAVVPL